MAAPWALTTTVKEYPMGYGDNRYGGDNRDGGDRSRGSQSGRMERERSSYGSWGSERDRDRSGGEDRGFVDRAGDEVRSWFGDDEAQRRREMDERRWEREQRMSGDRSNDYRGSTSFGGGFGNQRGWGDDHFDRDRDDHRRDHRDRGQSGSDRYPERGYSGGSGGGGGHGGGLHDPHYHQHRQRQIEELDRDYDEYRREHQSRFEQEFAGWREKRQTQRKHMTRAAEQMEVVGSDGEHIGTVDKVRGDRIILTKSDPNAGGMHHSIPCSWIENCDDKVTINKTAKEAIAAWRDEDHNRALFEREDQGSDGPHVLNRSFSGTYKDE
jgi:hypothetical protein